MSDRFVVGEPMTMYRRENGQEGFLVLAGDFFHCPPGVNHAIVGAGDVETAKPAEACAGHTFPWGSYKEGWLPE